MVVLNAQRLGWGRGGKSSSSPYKQGSAVLMLGNFGIGARTQWQQQMEGSNKVSCAVRR